MNEFVDVDFCAFYNQDEDNLSCINYDSEDGNYLLIFPEEINNYTKIGIMECLNNIEKYLKNEDMQHRELNMVDVLKYIIQDYHMK